MRGRQDGHALGAGLVHQTLAVPHARGEHAGFLVLVAIEPGVLPAVRLRQTTGVARVLLEEAAGASGCPCQVVLVVHPEHVAKTTTPA
ncbi:MAG: hypothetical protein IPI39_12355 [Candidatus Obscuribacter sp.]|nr:hypothetical protein [Candidatus Obscuribacter sp.]